VSKIFLLWLALYCNQNAIPFKLSTEPTFEPNDELKSLLAEVKADIKNDRNLSPALAGDEALAYLKGLRA